MLLPLKWLNEFIDYGMAPEALADALTMVGLEVEGIEERHQGLAKVVTAHVTRVEPHPNADKLRLAVVDYGSGTTRVVCGAPNLREGMVSALAQKGAVLADGFTVKKANIRGVESVGMLVSYKEMGLLDDHSGIVELDDGLAPGLPITEAVNLETQVLDIGITPNRGDGLSVLGVARDLAALTGRPLHLPEISFNVDGVPIEEAAAITISDPRGCPRYAGMLVRGVELGPSPVYIADRVAAMGMRPINNVVDITNYVLMERGQPLHGFDFSLLQGGKIDVRKARPGEVFTTLDSQERKLEQGMLLICDGEKPVALAGVMGGVNSEISDATRDVLIESAYFDPVSIRRTSKRLGLSTDASYRFERGIDRDGCALAARRAAQLLAAHCGGKVAPGILDVHPTPYEAPRLEFSVDYCAAYLGISLEKEAVIKILTSLEIEVEDTDDPQVVAAYPPAHRPDLERPVDLTEEVARLVGYNDIPAKLPSAKLGAQPRAWNQLVREKSRDLMAAQGWDEAISLSFDNPASADWLGLAGDHLRRRAVMLMNPISEDQSVMRTSLIPGLLAAVRRNVYHRVEDVALFEVGKCFLANPGEKLPLEPSRLAGALCGLAAPVSWHSGEVPAGFAHLSGAVEYLCEGLGLEDLGIESAEDVPAYLDPSLYCQAKLGDEILGEMGLLSTAAAQAFDLDKPTYIFDLDFDLMVNRASRERGFTHLPRYPQVKRDAAIIINEAVGAGEVLAYAREPQRKKAQKWLVQVELFDLYKGKPLAKGEKSLGLRFTFRDAGRTLTEEEVNPQFDFMVSDLLSKFQGELRK